METPLEADGGADLHGVPRFARDDRTICPGLEVSLIHVRVEQRFRNLLVEVLVDVLVDVFADFEAFFGVW